MTPKNISPRLVHQITVPGLSYESRIRLLYSPLFNGLDTRLQQMLAHAGTPREIRKGGLLFMAGGPVDSVYCLLSGKLKEYYTTEAGDLCLRRILTPGNYISLHLLCIRERTYSYTCEAVRKSLYFSWDATALRKLLRQEPDLSYQMALVQSCYTEDICRLHCICRKNQAVPRVAGYLLRQCSPFNVHFQCHKQPKLEANIKPIELTANDICLARETFSRALSSLQEEGIIRVKNGIVEILDIEALKRISGT